MPFCPNCAAELNPGEQESACSNCGALFGAGSAWKPMVAPLAQPPAKGERSSTGVKVIKFIAAVPLLLSGCILFIFAAVMDQASAFAAVPAIICFLAAAGIAVSRSAASIFIAIFIGAIIIGLLWGAFELIGAGIYAR